MNSEKIADWTMKNWQLVGAVICAVLLFAMLAGCAESQHHSELRNTTTVYQLTDTDINPGYSGKDGSDPDVTFRFKDMATGKTLTETYDASDYDTSIGDVKAALHKLDWLNVGECYTDPLSSQMHQRVTCG